MNCSGYMAPEYVLHGQYSMKSDVYSFGVLVVEIISGKRNSSFHQSNDDADLLTYVSYFLLGKLELVFLFVKHFIT